MFFNVFIFFLKLSVSPGFNVDLITIGFEYLDLFKKKDKNLLS